MDATQRTRRTYFYELWRASTAGIIETAGTTFLLLIAVRIYAASGWAKGLVAAGGSVGLLLSPLVVSAVTTGRWSPARAASGLLAFGAGCFLFAALVPLRTVFIMGTVLGMATSAAIIPLLTQMYQENYPERERGRRFSRTVMVKIVTAVIFSKLAGDALTGRMEYFPWLLGVFAAALALASFCLGRCPTRPLQAEGSAHPLRALRFVRQDALFRRTLICWMLMGFGNLMMLPLRVEYLANPVYNLGLTVGMVALLTGVIPNLARLLLSPVWGYLFDHMNFFALRMTLNVGFAIGIVAFFMSDTLTGMIVGAIVYGISNAGGDVAWGLWVIKFAPPERVADYMSVHTFFTGVRGVLAPLTAFYLVGWWNSITPLAWVSAGLIILATLLLLPELRGGRKGRPGSGLVEELSE